MRNWLSGWRIFNGFMRPDAPKRAWPWFLLAVPFWLLLFYLIHEVVGCRAVEAPPFPQ